MCLQWKWHRIRKCGWDKALLAERERNQHIYMQKKKIQTGGAFEWGCEYGNLTTAHSNDKSNAVAMLRFHQFSILNGL